MLDIGFFEIILIAIIGRLKGLAEILGAIKTLSANLS